MSRNTRFFLVVLVVLGMASTGCGGSTEQAASTPIVDSDGGTVTKTTTALTEAVVTGPACAYGLAISNDVQHRLNHYRICAPKEGQEQRQADALREAEGDCFDLCDETFPDENGGKTTENLTCVKQCKGE